MNNCREGFTNTANDAPPQPSATILIHSQTFAHIYINQQQPTSYTRKHSDTFTSTNNNPHTHKGIYTDPEHTTNMHNADNHIVITTGNHTPHTLRPDIAHGHTHTHTAITPTTNNPPQPQQSATAAPTAWAHALTTHATTRTSHNAQQHRQLWYNKPHDTTTLTRLLTVTHTMTVNHHHAPRHPRPQRQQPRRQPPR